MTERKTDLKKALKHESKGDKLFKKEKYREALEEYRKSEQNDPNRAAIYEKLVETHKRFEHEWVEEDFSTSLSWTMRQQELNNPELKWVHQTFTPEYQEIQKLVQGLLVNQDPQMETQIIARVLSFGEKAALPLVHFLLSLKNLSAQNPPDPNAELDPTLEFPPPS